MTADDVARIREEGEIGVSEAAARLGCTKARVGELIRVGYRGIHLEGYTSAGKIRTSIAACDRYTAAQEARRRGVTPDSMPVTCVRSKREREAASKRAIEELKSIRC